MRYADSGVAFARNWDTAGRGKFLKKNIFVDCDPGQDDALALITLLGTQEANVVGISTVAGNHTVENTTRNALKLLTLAGRTNIPVARGMSRPLVKELVIAPEVHGETGLTGDLPEPEADPVALSGPEFMARTFLDASEPLTLLAIGPLTNVAVALGLFPQMKEKIERLVIMGGGIGGGNVTPAAEFNFYVDPEAAALVLASGVPTVIAGLNVTHNVRVDRSDLNQYKAIGGHVADVISGMFDFYIKFHEDLGQSSPLHDVVAAVETMFPGTISGKLLTTTVDAGVGPARGQMISDIRPRRKADGSVIVGMDADADFVRKTIVAALEHLSR